ncbi:MAG: hypothetical protein ABIA75_01365 [Candidatus Neomarinimicrobiota bacterium]
MKKLFIVILACCSLALAQYGYGVVAGAVIEETENGAINYSQRIITATGIGAIPEYAVNAGQARAMAIRAAKADARRQLVEMVNGITLTSETTMRNRMADEVVKESVSGVITGAYQVGEVRYLSDTSVELTMAVSMSGISEVVTPVVGFAATAPADVATAPVLTTTAVDPAAGVYTGIIIDARGLNVRPAMAPKILDQNGSAVYGPGNYTREYAVTNGVAGYSKTLEAAREDLRVKGNPLVLKASSVSGVNRTDVVVTNADVIKINQANSANNVLRDCRILFLLD